MGRKIHLEPGVYIRWALGILLLPIQWVAAAGMAAAVHELFHWAAARLLGLQVFRISIGTKGCFMETQSMDDRQELLCAAAGPLGSLLLLSLIHIFPRLAICGAVQGLYNLLPLYPLDGGRIFAAGTRMLLRESRARQVCLWTEQITVALLLLTAVWFSICWNWGIPAIAAGVFLMMRLVKTKNSLQTAASRGTIELPFSKR